MTMNDPTLRCYPSGRRISLLNPTLEQIHIADIAHHLSLMPRYLGGTEKPYCVTPDTRVLTGDLAWTPVGDILVGDKLISLDEYPPGDNTSRPGRRKLKLSTALNNTLIRRPVYALHMSNGMTVKSSTEHPWLVATKISSNQQWRTTDWIVRRVQKKHKVLMKHF